MQSGTPLSARCKVLELTQFHVYDLDSFSTDENELEIPYFSSASPIYKCKMQELPPLHVEDLAPCNVPELARIHRHEKPLFFCTLSKHIQNYTNLKLCLFLSVFFFNGFNDHCSDVREVEKGQIKDYS